MRVFLTGATGFVGHSLLALLNGHEVLCLARRHDAASCGGSVEEVSGDFGVPSEWIDRVASFQPDVCVHLAWEGLPDYSSGRCASNVEKSLAFARAVAETGCPRLVVAGSCWEYGDAEGAVSEDAFPRNPGVFAQAKRDLHDGLMAFASGARPFDLCWARIFFAYGPGQRSGSLIPYCVSRLAEGKTLELKQPRAIQDFIHVDDVARGLEALMGKEVPPGPYNIGSGQGMTVNAVARYVARTFGIEVPDSGGSGAESGFWADTSRIRRLSGWAPRIDIEGGIAQTVRALRDSPDA